MAIFLSLAVLVVCTLIIWQQLRSGWPGWIGFPLALIAFRIALEVGISPWAQEYFQIVPLFLRDRVSPEQLPITMALILLSYSSIAGGMIAVRLYSGRGGTYSSPESATYLPSISNRAWKASVLMAAIGLGINLLVLGFLLRDASLTEIAARRAAFTNESALSNRIYNYARLFSDTMLVGSLGMILFSGGSSFRLRVGFFATATYMLFQAILGGRSLTFFSMVSAAIIYHYGVRRIRLKEILPIGLITFAGLLYINVQRFGITSFGVSMLKLGEDFLTRERVNDVALMLRLVPEVVPHAGPSPILAGLSHAIPEIPIPGAKNTWLILVEYLYGGQNPWAGIGGTNFATAAELYLAFGVSGIIVFGAFYGLFWGLLFEWHRKSPHNPFILLFMSLMVTGFFGGISAKMSYAIGGAMVGTYVPVVILAALTYSHRRKGQAISLFAYFAATSFMIYHLMKVLSLPFVGVGTSLIFKYTTLAFLVGLYFLGFKLLTTMGSLQIRELPRKMKMGWLSGQTSASQSKTLLDAK